MRIAFWGFLLFLTALAGCGGETTNSGGASPTGDSTSDEIKTREISDLPPVEDPLPVADQGRALISLPVDWKPLPKKPTHLVACVPQENSLNSLPRITVTVTDPPAGVASRTTKENAWELANKVADQLRKEKKYAIESPRPIILGNTPWVRHVRQSSFKDDPVAIQYLQTVQSGRLYTIDLTVEAKDNPRSSTKPIIYEKNLQAHRDFAYAVAANMKFPKEADSSSEPALPTEETPADTPAETEKSE